MNYYEQLLLNENEGLRRIKRVFMWVGMFHFVTGLVFIIITAIVWWTLVFVPAIWFCIGFIYGNIGYIFVTDYKYIYDNGTLHILKHRRFGKYRPVVSARCGDIVWDGEYGRTVVCTNRTANLIIGIGDKSYKLTVDDYLLHLLKGEENVS